MSINYRRFDNYFIKKNLKFMAKKVKIVQKRIVVVKSLRFIKAIDQLFFVNHVKYRHLYY